MQQTDLLPGTVVWVAPLYNRTGYSIGARASIAALHRAGVRVRAQSTGGFEPGVDDCDLNLIRSLEETPMVPPVTAIIAHVPHSIWFGLKFPEPNVRIISTTFESSIQGNVPPPDWVAVCHEMDQVWLMLESERQAFLSAGVPADKIKLVYWPHAWVENPVVGPPISEPSTQDRPFRFLSISMFQPRRRWDALIEAYLEEFKGNNNAELYLKVNYPVWHPIPGKPRQDLHDLIGSLRRKSGSKAEITIDEDLGTRMGILHLMDSCNAYVSTDTASTAPISEARVRQRLVILPDGVLSTPAPGVGIAVDPDAKFSLTPEMILYQPHHTGTFMPKLHVKDIREALRSAYAMSPEERRTRAVENSHIQHPRDVVPMITAAIEAAWEQKRSRIQENNARNIRKIVWEGPQLTHDPLAVTNRELCLQLIESGLEVSVISSGKDAIDANTDLRLIKIAAREEKGLSGKANVHIRHQGRPDFTPPTEGHWVIFQPWEFGRVPESWVEPMSTLIDEIWVPNRHVLKSFIASGIPAELVQLVPNGVDVKQFFPNHEKTSGQNSKKFRFLFAGGGLWREGLDILLEAYRSAFSRRDDVVLIVKDFPQGLPGMDQGAQRLIRTTQNNPGAPEIIHYTEMLGLGQMPGFYKLCDCMVHPYRAEGPALQVLEAVACGIPVITTQGGATDDFCSPNQSYLIPARRIDYTPSDVKLAGGAGWVLEPDLKSLTVLLRKVYENRRAAKQKALAASEFVRFHFSWDKVAQKVMERMDRLMEKPVRRLANSRSTQ